jgi:CRISPR-associated endonuclease Csn1
VTATIGSVTDKLREDWELVEVMKELNWDKYHKLGLTKEEEKRRTVI